MGIGNAYVVRDDVRSISIGDKIDALLPTVIAGFRDLVELKRPDMSVLVWDKVHRKNPRGMDFGIYSPIALSPNAIGFEFVLTAIAYRQKIHQQKVLGITVDRQSQFNGAQVKTYDIQSKMSAALRGNGDDRVRYLAHPFMAGVRQDAETLIAHFPEKQLTIEESGRSFGLQITDTYLWLLNRYIKTGEVVPGFEPILESFL